MLQKAINEGKPFQFKLTAQDAIMLNENKNPNKYSEEMQVLIKANKK